MTELETFWKESEWECEECHSVSKAGDPTTIWRILEFSSEGEALYNFCSEKCGRKWEKEHIGA